MRTVETSLLCSSVARSESSSGNATELSLYFSPNCSISITLILFFYKQKHYFNKQQLPTTNLDMLLSREKAAIPQSPAGGSLASVDRNEASEKFLGCRKFYQIAAEFGW